MDKSFWDKVSHFPSWPSQKSVLDCVSKYSHAIAVGCDRYEDANIEFILDFKPQKFTWYHEYYQSNNLIDQKILVKIGNQIFSLGMIFSCTSKTNFNLFIGLF